MGRAPCCENKEQLKKGPWTPEEDQKLIAHINQHGHGCWKSLPRKAGLLRCGKSCRLRWANYLRPGIRRGGFTLQEEQTIIQLHALLGNKWSAIATHLERRTDNEVKNYWNTRLKKRLVKMGIDPTTHKPTGGLWNEKERQSRQLSHIAQWENARLEAETRLRTGSYKMDLQSHPYSFNFMNTKTISPDLQQETSPFCTAPDAGKILGTQNSFPSSSEASVAGKESSSVTFYDELGTLSAGSLGHNGDMVLDTNTPTLNEENKDFWSNILDSIL